MTILDTLKETVNTAVEAISSVTQTMVDKNRTKAKLNRLRLVMKNESELMNRAYIALGKTYYEMQKKGEVKLDDKQKQLFDVIENSKAKIARARTCYRTIVESNDEFIYTIKENAEPEYKADDVVDITVACSNENEYDSSPFEAAAEEAKNISEEAKDFVEEATAAVKNNVKETFEKVENTVEEVAEEVEEAPDSDELF